MYGLVNKAVRDMLIEKHGMSRWEEICRRAGCPSDEFLPLKSYPDDWTYRIIRSASELLDVPEGELLEELGVYWIRFTANEGYGDLMDLFGRDFRSCLRNLDQMHDRMGALMPELQPPKFRVFDSGPREILVEYTSKRRDLAPMVLGILKGLGRKFNERIEVSLMPEDHGDHTRAFRVIFLQ